MKVAILVLAVVVALSAGQRTRREIREVMNGRSPGQGMQDYLDGVKCLQQMKGGAGKATEWDEFSNVHYSDAKWNHGYPRFLPWHRLFLIGLEKAMSDCTKRSITLPWWNWAIDASSDAGFFGSPIFAVLGGDGSTTYNYQASIPNPHKLQRRFDKSARVSTSEQVASLMDTSSFETMAEGLEWQLHGTPHVAIGGDMANMYSSNDPLFYLHHCQVDRLWAEWQKDHPANAGDFSGANPINGGKASTSDVMSLGPYLKKYAADRPVSALLSVSSLGYTYSFGSKSSESGTGGTTGGASSPTTTTTKKSKWSLFAKRGGGKKSPTSSGGGGSSGAAAAGRRPPPGQGDDKPKTELKLASQLPAYWVRMNRIPPNRYEALHQKLNKFVEWFNRNPSLKPRRYTQNTKFRSRTQDELRRKRAFQAAFMQQYKSENGWKDRADGRAGSKAPPSGGFQNWRPPRSGGGGAMGGGRKN
jgi:tyrosinase